MLLTSVYILHTHYIEIIIHIKESAILNNYLSIATCSSVLLHYMKVHFHEYL